MKDYRVEVKVKNNYLYQAMLRKGIKSNSELHRLSGVSNMSIGRYMNLTETPFKKDGTFHETAIKISKALNTPIFNLFPQQHLERPLIRNKAILESDISEMRSLVSDIPNPLLLIEKREVSVKVINMLDKLSPRHKNVIEKRFFDGKTLEETAEGMGITRERVGQIEAKAIRQLRRTVDAKELREFIK